MKRRAKFLGTDGTIVSRSIREAFLSVLPISVIILILCVTVTPIDNGIFLAFLLGAVMVVVGMGFFTMGANMAMTPIGQYISSSIIKTKKTWIILPLFFL